MPCHSCSGAPQPESGLLGLEIANGEIKGGADPGWAVAPQTVAKEHHVRTVISVADHS